MSKGRGISSVSVVVCEGYLTKRATKASRFQISTWKRRYFRLWRCRDCPRLEYFSSTTSKKAKGIIYIDVETKVMLCGKYRDKSEFCFKLVAPEQKKCLYAYADTSAEIDNWISMISKAIKNHKNRESAPSPSPTRKPKPSSGPKPPPPSYQSRMPASSRAARSRFRDSNPRQSSTAAIPSPHTKAQTDSPTSNPAGNSTTTFKAIGKQNDGNTIDLLELTKAQLYNFLMLNDLTGYATQFMREGVNGNDLATFDEADFEDFSGLKFQLRKLKRLVTMAKAWGVDLPSLEAAALSAQIGSDDASAASEASGSITSAGENLPPPPPPAEAPPPPPPPPASAESTAKAPRSSNMLTDIEKFSHSALRKVTRKKSKRRKPEKNSISQALFERNQKISGAESSEDDDEWSLNDSDSD